MDEIDGWIKLMKNRGFIKECLGTCSGKNDY